MGDFTPEPQDGRAESESMHPEAETEGSPVEQINEDTNVFGDDGHSPAADFSDDDGGASPALDD